MDIESSCCVTASLYAWMSSTFEKYYYVYIHCHSVRTMRSPLRTSRQWPEEREDKRNLSAGTSQALVRRSLFISAQSRIRLDISTEKEAFKSVCIQDSGLSSRLSVIQLVRFTATKMR